MTEESHALYLNPISGSQGKTRTGLVGYGPCEGRFKKGFHLGDDGVSNIVPNTVEREFQMDLTIIRKEGE